MLDKIASNFRFMENALNLRAYRTEVLASNMANAETPYYKAVDFDFSSALTSRLAGKRGDGSMQDLALLATDARHFQSSLQGAMNGVKLQYRQAVQPSLDANTVDMDVERSAFMDNTLHYQSTLSFLNNKFASLNQVLKG